MMTRYCKRPRGRRDILGPCPVCGAPAVLVRSMDRFYHANGSDCSACIREMGMVPNYPKPEDFAALDERYDDE